MFESSCKILSLCRLREDKHKFFTNLEIQLLMKQGQVEVDGGTFLPNYTSSLLLCREVVEDLNKKIRVRIRFKSD